MSGVPSKIWEGEVAFILGGGPSLSLVDFDLIKERRIIAVNNSYGKPVKGKGRDSKEGWFSGTVRYDPYDWVDFLWFGDGRWFDMHRKFLRKFKGMIAHCAPRIAKRNLPGIFSYRRGKQYGIETDRDKVSWNKSSGGSAINFAYHLGVKRIVLLGFDMKRIDNKPNWHTDHPAYDTKNPYYRFLRGFPFIEKQLTELGVEVINCTVGSVIQEFKIMKLEDYLKWELKKA